jgi:signal transduction histidine kinase
VISLFETDAAGAAQERVLARARFVLVAASLVAIYIDPTEPARYSTAAYVLLISYAGTSLLYLVALPHLEAHRRWVAGLAHAFDVLALAVLTAMTGASSSPLFPLFTFVVLAAALRWGYVETLATTLAILWVVILEGILLAQQGLGAPFELNWFLVRISYMAIAGVLLAYLASHEKQLRLESALVARILSRLRSETTLDAALETAGRELLHAFGARTLAIAVKLPATGRTVQWTLDGEAGELQRSPLSEAEGDAYLADAPSAFILKRRRKRVLITATARGLVGPLPSPIVPAQSFAAALVASASYPEWFGRIFVFDPVRRVGNVSGLRLLARVNEAVAPALHAIFLIGRLRARSEASERARLARELHDTSIQSLIGLEMEVLALSRRISDSTLRDSINTVHARLLYEIRTLRKLMAHLGRSEAAASPITERLTEMLATFQVESGIRTRLVSSAAVAVPARVGQQILHLIGAALSNVRRHSGATYVDVALERHGDGWRLVIEDDGQGFRTARGRAPAVTPWSLRERVATLGGELVVDRRKGVGVRVEITLPSLVLSA